MKHLITFLILIISVFSLKATHNRAGEILYKRIMPFYNISGNEVFTYSITLITYTGDGSLIADRCVDTLDFGDGTKATLHRSNGITAGCGCGPGVGCGEIISGANTSFAIKKNIFTTTHTYAGTGSYKVQFFDFNRNANILNIPNSLDQAFYIESMIIITPSLGANSSPLLINPPTGLGIISTCYYHNPCAFDADGDSLSYELVPCKGADGLVIPGYSFPSAGTGGNLDIDVTTGLFFWCNPQSVGEYNFAIVVKEWRKQNCNGVYQLIGSVTRDMQVVINGGAALSFSTTPLTDTCMVAGQILYRTFTANSALNVEVSLAGSASESQPPATLTPSAGLATANTAFSWQPGCNLVRKQPHQVNIVYKTTSGSPNNMTFYRKFNVKVLPPAVRIYSMVCDSGSVSLRWKKPGCPGNIAMYNIYRKMGPNTWSHGPCEEGLPPSSGFQLIGYIQSTDTFFVDNNLSLYPSGTTGNYVVTAITRDCAESFADSIRAGAIITGIKQLQLNPASVSIYPNPVKDQLIVRFSTTHSNNVQASLYAMDGRLVYESTEKINEGKAIIQNLDLKAGVYLVCLKTSEGLIYKKIIKE